MQEIKCRHATCNVRAWFRLACDIETSRTNGRSNPTAVAAHALPLAQDPFGNYVVQYVLELDIADASIAVMNNLFGHYADLAQQKFSSNVVEKCLKLGGSQLNEVRPCCCCCCCCSAVGA